MKESIQIAKGTSAVELGYPLQGSVRPWLTRVADYWELTKPGITFLAVITTFAGFYLGTHGTPNPVLLLSTLLGTALVAAGGGALNHFIERDLDAKMHRTEHRPIPTGRIQPVHGLIFGTSLSIIGVLELALLANFLTSFLGAVTLLGYLFVYTPLKKKTSLSTVIGGIPGAIPPVMGWTAVSGNLSIEPMALFTIFYLWQIPHFLAIAWMYRKDYARAGFPMLTVIDPECNSASRQIVIYSIALLGASLMPALFGLTGPIYFFGAFGLGLTFTTFGICLAVFKSNLCAKRLLLASIFYVPLLLALMIFDKLST